MVCAVADDEDDPSKPTCACWVGDRANCFAVGYDDGSILVWGVPAAALKGNAARVAAASDAVLVLSLRVAPEGVDAAPVRGISFIAGTEGTPGEEDCLLVCGGQAASDPDMLTMVPLEPETQGGVLPSLDPYDNHLVMSLKDFANHPIARELLHDGASFQVHPGAGAVGARCRAVGGLHLPAHICLGGWCCVLR